jgi:hypothetical protein
VDLRALLRTEYRRRRDRNPRYSVRAFAQWLGEDHSTVLRALSGRRRIARATSLRLVRRLGLPAHEADTAFLTEGERTLAALVARRDFRPDARWLAVRSGLTLDEVCVVLHALLHARRIAMPSPAVWRLENPA